MIFIQGASFKKGRIDEIWEDGFGPLVMHPFIGISEEEALYREHCMIMARMTVNWEYQKRGIEWPSTIFGGHSLLVHTLGIKIFLGPMCLANKNDGLQDAVQWPIQWKELKWLEEERMEAGAFMLLQAFVQFRQNPLEQHYREGFTYMVIKM
jgi:hypothetical protein